MQLMRRFRRDDRGVSAVEFALVLPIMVLLYLGLTEIMMSMMAERRAQHAASAVGDLVAQNPRQKIAKADVDAIFYVGVASLRPYPTDELSLRVSSVQSDANNVPRVLWSLSQGPALPKKALGEAVDVPGNLLNVGDSVIMSEVAYSYDNPLMKIIPRSLSFTDTFYLRPRRTSVITCTDC